MTLKNIILHNLFIILCLKRSLNRLCIFRDSPAFRLSLLLSYLSESAVQALNMDLLTVQATPSLVVDDDCPVIEEYTSENLASGDESVLI